MKAAATTRAFGPSCRKPFYPYMRVQALRYWRGLLRETHHNISACARISGTNRTNVYKILTRLGLHEIKQHRGRWHEFGL
jgi:hypothetical protein